MSDFYINIEEKSSYPSSKYGFSPGQIYPEYLWGEQNISKERNYAYEMVRDCLIGLELDKNNIGTKKWNPFSFLIKEKETVIIKPNWVFHKNKNKRVKINSIECLVTHPSIVRAIIDYVLIALNGTGKVIVGDAPMQGCDLGKLLIASGYDKMFAFYRKFKVDIQQKDFRNYYSVVDKNGVIRNKVYNNTEFIDVDLGNKSKHYSPDNAEREYKVSDYSKRETTACHNRNIHKYFIAKDVLSADVVINLSKPKCHRLSGITAALKNIVGITYDKSCLPHRIVGSAQEGGDEYLNKSVFKKGMAKIQESQVSFENKNFYIPALILRYIYGILYFLIRIISKDKYLLGSWYGNDTVWRTVFDLNYIILYADKVGNLQTEIQRKIFNIADMIIAGEGNGPVSPEPKYLGLMVAGHNSLMSDRLICEIMGFDYNKVPGLYESISSNKLSTKDAGEYLIGSNKEEYNNKRLTEIKFASYWKFKPYNTWIGHIEK